MEEKEEDLRGIGSEIKRKVIERLGNEKFKEINLDLPVLDTNFEFRSEEDLARRIVILYSLKAITIYPEDYKNITGFLKREGYNLYMNDEEKLIFQSNSISKKQEIMFSWYSESLYILLWLSGIINQNSTGYPNEEISIDKSYLDLLPPEVGFNSFKDSISYREINSILEELYYYYHLHWIVKRNTKKSLFKKIINSKKNNLNFSVVLERRKALEWFVDSNLSWNNFTLDT